MHKPTSDKHYEDLFFCYFLWKDLFLCGCVWVPVEARRMTDPLKLDLQVAVSCYEQNQGLHQGLLTAESFLQLWLCYF